ncbi:MAG: hypothetical protein AAF655_23650 [Bacteroidota bacterium]
MFIRYPMHKNILSLISLLLLLSSCQNPKNAVPEEEAQIIETLQLETQYFCERKLAEWQNQWTHESYVSKMYAGKIGFEEFTNWEEIYQFTVDHINEFPDPIPIPESDQAYTVELFGETAFVFYTKEGEEGPVRETRFMVKEGDKWRIARMQTIY